MHIHYAREQLQYNIEQSAKHGWKVPGERAYLEGLFQEPKFLDFCENLGDEKTKSIIKTIKEKLKNKHFTVTYLMKCTVLKDIEVKISAKEIIEKIFS